MTWWPRPSATRIGARRFAVNSDSSPLARTVTQTATTKQLSDTEDADFAKTMLDLNSQSTAYQAALRAGASIVQSSLMDFLK